MKIVFTEDAPNPIGPFSQAIEINNLIFCSGQIGVNPQSGKVESDDVQGQTRQVLENIKSVLKEAGLDLSNVAKTTVFLKDMNDFQKMNEIYASYFGDHAPARSAVEVARLPLDVLVEIESIAIRK